MKPITSRTWAFASLLLLALMPILPLFSPWTLQPIPSFHQEWLAVISGLLASLTALPLLWRSGEIAIPKTVAIPLLLLVYIGLQSALLPGIVVQHAQMAMLYLLWAAVLMILVVALRETLNVERIGRWLALGLALAAACASWRELFFRLQGESGWWGGIAQANNYGDLLSLGGVSLLYLQDSVKSSRRRWLWLLAAGIVMGLSLTPSRSVWLYWATLFLLAWRYQATWLRGLLAGFAAYLLFQGLWMLDVLPQQQTAAERLLQEVDGAPLRLHIWQVAWHLFLQSPLLGHGFGQFDWAYFQTGDHIPALVSRMEHAHNLILHLLAELGLLPVLLLSIALGGWLKPLLSIGDRPELIGECGADASPAKAWLLMLVAILGIHSMLEYPLWYAQFLGLAALILALGDGRYWRIRLPKAGAAVFGGLMAVSVAVAGLYEWQYTRLELALLAAVAEPTQTRTEHLGEVCREIPERARLLLPYVPVIFTMTSNATNSQMRQELTALTDAGYRFWPTDKLAYRQSLMQALDGREPEARKTLKLAMAAYPRGVEPFFGELMRLNVGDLKKARSLLNMVAVAAIQKKTAIR